MITEDNINKTSPEDREFYDRAPKGYLSIDKDGWLVPSGAMGEELQRVAYVQTAPSFGLVQREIQASLMSANALRVLSRDPSFKKLSAQTRDEVSAVLASLE